jgi:glucose 1-dehydrogenase
MSDLSGKRALVTGAGMGIGQGIAVELAHQGADVAVHYAHSEKDANETVTEVKRLGGKPALVQGDLSKKEECERVVDEAARALDGLDVLITWPWSTI